MYKQWRFGKDGHGKRAEREPITEVWGPGAEPLVGGSGGFAP